MKESEKRDKNILKNFLKLVDTPLLLVDKKQNILSTNENFLKLLETTNISKNNDLSLRIKSFIENPEKFVNVIGSQDKGKYIRSLTNNPKILNLLDIIEQFDYKLTHITSITTNIGFDQEFLSHILIVRLFHSKSSKSNEYFLIIFDIDLTSSILYKSVSVEQDSHYIETSKKYTVLIQVMNMVLSVVKGFTETILLGNYHDINLVRNLIKIMDDEVSKGLKIMLSFNLSDNIGPINFQNINTTEFLKKIVDRYTEKILTEYPNVEFSFYIQPNIPNLYTDPSKLELCLHNILDNALRFRDDKKERNKIKFEAFFDSSKSIINIIIEDNGIGMNQEQVSQIGQIFRTFSSKSGVGLGMYTTYKICRTMGWNIQIQSSENQYTKVILQVPHAS
ncbi:MAG: HAMP domain-containing sensor histidine kinase [bacterium]